MSTDPPNTSAIRIGIDLGGTKTELLAIDAHGVARHRVRVATPAADYGAILECIRNLVLEAERALRRRCSVGVGTPGSSSPTTGLMRNSNTTCLNGRPLHDDLRNILGREVRMANDADCFALSEAIDGAARDARVVFGVIAGTGVGGAIIVDQKLWTGANAIAGEWGHNPLPWPRDDELPGPECYCGKRGCIETFVSGPALLRTYLQAGGRADSAEQVAAHAGGGEALAQTALDTHACRMARALASVINLLDPDVIVLGGGVSGIASLYTTLPQVLPRYVFSDAVRTALRPAQHGPAGGVRGAAWLWSIEEAEAAADG